MAKSQIGLIGLAVMGENLARNIAGHGFKVSVFNRTTEKTDKFIEKFKKNSLLTGTRSLKEFINSLKTPRKIILLVKAGEAVDEMIKKLTPLLNKNDILIDCGNSHFKDTERRQEQLKQIHFIGCGISGGEEGALKGPSLMPGGDKKAWQKIKPIFEKIAAKDFSGKPCVTYLGPSGSGHFIKMVHNGIEYAIMQLIAESYDILKNIGKFPNPELAKIFSNFSKTENLESFLIEITARIFRKREGSKYIIDLIRDSAGQKGTGKWTTEEGLNLSTSIPIINAAVDARIISGNETYRKNYKTFPKIILKTKKQNITHLVRDALELSIVLSYIQGFELISKANPEYNWNLSLNEITRIWQGGCIIRSKILKKFMLGYGKNQQQSKSAKKSILKEFSSPKQKNWRKLLILTTSIGLPTPALSNALTYYDTLTNKHLPQNLIQAQRDFFGAHGYERTDKKGEFHTNWS